MPEIPTVRGSVDTDDLGRVLMHEHVFVLSQEIQKNYPEIWDEQQRVDDAITKLRALRDAGIDTIVDPTVIGLGRDIARVQRINEQVDINIVPATGVYTYNDVPMFLHFQGPGRLFDVPEPMVGMFVQDLTEGIADTGVRAAFLKCAIDTPGMTPDVERIMRAVAAAHRETGAPITVHTNVHNRSGLDALDLLRQERVDLTKVVMGHSGDSTDEDYLTRIADAGCLLGMDRFGLDVLLDFEKRVDTVARLVERGYAGHLVLAHDAACHNDWFPPEQLPAAAPNWHYQHITDDVLPALRERGVTEEHIHTMLVENPRRYFA